MYDDLIILTPPLQHSSGSSPHHHLHTSCFDFMWLICFPTSFYISLSLLSSLLSCCARPPLYFFPASHPASLPSVRLQVAFSPASLVSLNLPAFLPFFLHLCPPFLPTLWHSQVAMLPFSSLFFSAPPITRSPLSLPEGYSCSGPNSCIAFVGCLCELPLHCRPLWDP